MGAMSSSGGDKPERSGPPLCVHYMTSERCKSGTSCKNLHPGHDSGSPTSTTLNIHGYPLGPGKKNCSYYVRTGKCKFGATCKFHHPLPAGVQAAAHVPGPALVRPAASASTQPNGGSSPVYGLTQFYPQAPAYSGQYVPVSSFPAPSGSSVMYDYFADLPQELLLDILIRLPPKSIGFSRCVSKPWLSLLSNYKFIKAHLAHHSHIAQEQNLLLLSSRLSLFSLSLTPHLAGNHLRKLKFFDGQVTSFVGSCNGLVLVATRERVNWLVNCMTQEYVKLPTSPLGLCPLPSFKKYGFEYDELSDDYKIVKISQYDYGGMRKCPGIFVDIYSLRMRSWKRLGIPLYGHDLFNDDDCVFINGAFHYMGLKFNFSPKESVVIVALDLSSETFKEFPAPATVNDDYKFKSAKLMFIDGCLGMVLRPYAALRTEIWLMKSYSLVESWTKLVVDFTPLCYLEDKILFKDKRDENLKWHCVKDGRVEVCLVNEGGLGFGGITYYESLVSPHFNYHH